MVILNSTQRRGLRARAHALSPVVLIGNGGLSAGVISEIDRCLNAHELIKIRVASADRDDRETLLNAICTETSAAPVQHIGKILVVYRERPPEINQSDTSKASPPANRRGAKKK